MKRGKVRDILNKLSYEILKKILMILGYTKVFRYPMFVVYDPGSYLVKGDEIRQVLNTIRPGDILLRSYKNYLDGYLIPGFFSHVAFYKGDGRVIHAIGYGVLDEDILTFTRCDSIAIMRFKPGLIDEETIKTVIQRAESLIGKKYDFQFQLGDDKYYCSEFVREIYKEKQFILSVDPEPINLLFGLVKRKAILPDAFWSSPALKCVYCNKIVREHFSSES